jgi:dienelactone hydrolase
MIPARRMLAVCAVAVVAAGCSTTPEPTASAVGPDPVAAVAPTTTVVTDGRPRTVTVTTVALTDPSRPTEPVVASAAASDSRALPTTVYLPSGDQPAPLVVFSHGLGGHPDKFTRLHTAWAEAGYVVASPRFPLTSDDNPDHIAEVGDLINQPADVSFVLDSVLAANDDPASELFGRIDPDRVGAAGLSLGGATTYGVLYNDCCADARFDAAVIMAGAVLVYTGDNDFSRAIPTLVLHGDADVALAYQFGRDGWNELPSPTWMVTLLGAPHAPPFEDPVTPWDDTVFATTTAFWDATLGGQLASVDLMTQAVAAAADIAVIESR